MEVFGSIMVRNHTRFLENLPEKDHTAVKLCAESLSKNSFIWIIETNLNSRETRRIVFLSLSEDRKSLKRSEILST